MKKDLKKILVVNVNWLGDVIFSTPVFKALKKEYPQAFIATLAPQRVKGALECCSFIDEVIPFDERVEDRSPWAKLRIIFKLRARQFDAAFILHKSLTRALITFLAGIPERVGYDTKGRGFLLTHKVKTDPSIFHRRDYYLRVIESYGIKVTDRTCELGVDEKDASAVGELLKIKNITPQDFLVVVNAGGNWDLKRWPKDNFSRLVDGLQKEKNMKVVLSGAPKDKELVHDIASKTITKPLILSGQTSLKELLALMKRANLVIAADTGPLHVANAVGTPTVALFGPTRPESTGPVGKGKVVLLQNDVGCNRLPCYFLECPSNVCMQSISVEQVLEAVKQCR